MIPLFSSVVIPFQKETSCTFLTIKFAYTNIPAGIYLFKVNNRNTRARCEICSKLTIKTPERGVFRWSVSCRNNVSKMKNYLKLITYSVTQDKYRG